MPTSLQIRCTTVCSVFAMLLFVAVQVSAADAKPKTKLKGLIITGGCCHDYLRQNVILSEGLSQRVSIAWDIVYEGDPNDREYKISVYNNPNWSTGYDVVVHNECYGHMKDVKFLEGI